MLKKQRSTAGLAVLVSALGYFVDIYDLFIFTLVRQTSLRELPDLPQGVFHAGIQLLNLQMAGVFIGGFFWGMISDRWGRAKVLFLSIFIYSTANLLNGWVTQFEQYQILRFIAGFGLAGELGVAVTLVSELLPRERRGVGTTLIASIGICGGIFAAIASEVLSWRHSYFLGAFLGYGLLFLRFHVSESSVFLSSQNQVVSRGSLRQLFLRWDSLKRYTLLVLSGIPVWFCGGIVIVFAPEFAQALGVGESFRMSHCSMVSFAATALGDLSCGLLSQKLKSRKAVLILSLILFFSCVVGWRQWGGQSLFSFYFWIFLMSFATGYWAVLVSFAAEQFGTNLRATVTTSVPNVVRGCVIPLTLGFQMMNQHFSLLSSVLMMNAGVILFAVLSVWFLKETFARDLDFVEQED